MKKVITAAFVSVMMLISTNAFAQLSASVGFTNSKTVFDVYSLVNMKANLNGVYGGFTYNIPIGVSGLGFAPGVYFSYLMKNDASLAVVKGDLSESYLTVPMDLNFSTPVADGIKFIVFGGPSLSIGATSNVNISGVTTIGEKLGIPGTINGNNDMYDGALSKYIGYDRFDVLLGGGIGMDFEDIIRFTVGYDCGLLNRGGNTVGIHRNQFHFGVAYLF